MINKHPLKKYPEVGACGLDCGLCPIYHSESTSKCPGCCGPDFFQKHPTCAVITCCVKQKNLEVCAQCADWAGCEKALKRLNTTVDSVISYKPIAANFAFIREHGIEEFARLELEKQGLLKHLLDMYNDGRARRFYCTACQLLPLDKLKKAVADVEAEIAADTAIKEKASAMRSAISALAEDLKIDLRLRK